MVDQLDSNISEMIDLNHAEEHLRKAFRFLRKSPAAQEDIMKALHRVENRKEEIKNQYYQNTSETI